MNEPKGLRNRPHFQGMPVPATVKMRPDGTPDFTDVDWPTGIRFGHARLCFLCGERIGATVAFLGGPNTAEHGAFNDGPMHEACARYAAVVCPYVSGQHRKFRKDERPPGIDAEAMFLTLAKRYRMDGTGGALFRVEAPWRSYEVGS